MLRLRNILLSLCVLIIAVTTAVAQHNVIIEGVTRVSHLSTSGMNLWVEVDNGRSSALVVKSATVDVMADGRHLVTISLRDKVVVPRKARGEVLLPLRFRSRSSFVLSSLLRRIAEGDTDGLTLSYSIKAGNRLVKRRIEAEYVALNDIFRAFDMSRNLIMELEQFIE